MLLSYSARITGNRIINSSMIPTWWDIQIDFFSVLDDDSSSDDDTNNIEATIAFNVLAYWLNDYMDDLLVFDPSDKFSREMALLCNNPMFMTPGVPMDDLIVKLLHCKMNSITKGKLCVMKTSLRSDDGGGLAYNYVNPDGIMDDNEVAIEGYFQGVGIKHSTPWWMRKNAVCYDFSKDETESAKVTELEVDDPNDILARYARGLREQYSIDGSADMLTSIIQKLQERNQESETTDNITVIPTYNDESDDS
jgi:hypothetical protein